MSDLSPLVADDGELRLARRVASYVYGRREVTWPEGVDDPEDGLPDNRKFGWVAKLPGPEPGLSERRFVRGDVQIDAVARVSNVERVLDDAASRAGGDVFFESMVEGRGLGRLVPGRDFDEGDLVDVRFWGRILQDQLVTAVEWHDGVPSVKLGGQLVSDTDELARARTETMRLISQERRERLESVYEVSQTASSAQSTAADAQSTAAAALAAASVAVVATGFEFAVSDSESVAPGSGWGSVVPSRVPGEFLWQRAVVEFGDGRVERAEPVLVTGNTGPQGPQGEPGSDGVAGRDGVGVVSTTVDYASSTSGTTPPTSGWSVQPPAASPGRFVWSRFVWSYSDGTSETGYSVGKIGNTGPKGDTGADGLPGKDGTKLVSTAITYAVSTSGTTAPTSGWASTPPSASPGQFMWTRSVWTYSDGTSETGYAIGKIGETGPKGDSGKDGVAGKDGVGIATSTVTYAMSTSGTTAPTSGWVASPPTAVAGRFMWTRLVISYTDGTSEEVFSVGKIGETGPKGDTGSDGAAGKDGVGLKSTAVTYAVSASGTTAPTSGWVSSPPSASPGQFVWTKFVWSYTDGTSETGYSIGKIGNTGPKGDTGKDGVPGKDGVGIASTVVDYASSTSGTTPPTSGWASQPPAAAAGRFVWSRTTLNYTDGSSETVYSVGKIGETGATGPQGPKGATGPQGPKGDTGADGLPGKDGTKLVSTTITYASSTSGTTAPTSGWAVSPPAASAGRYMWTRSVWTYSDGTTETGYSIGKIGETGPQGMQGPQGATGATGPKGDTGPQGVSVTSVTRFWRWAGTNPGTPTGTGNPSGWSTTQPGYVVGQKLWTTTRTIFSNNTASWAPTTEEASVAAATAISTVAANDKNRIWYAATAPGSTQGSRTGDTWFQYSGTTIVGQWKWSGSAWESQKIGDQVIANLDAGKITTGYLDAQRIAANSITASRLVVSQPGNLIANGNLANGLAGWSDRLNGPFKSTLPDPPGGLFVRTSAGQGTLHAHGTAADPHWMDVVPGAYYAFEIWMFGEAGSVFYLELKDQDDAHAGKSTGEVVNAGDVLSSNNGAVQPVSRKEITSGWKRYSCVYKMSDSALKVRFKNWFFNHSDGTNTSAVINFGGVSLRPMSDASLIVDGAIKAEHLEAGSITASHLRVETGNLFPDPHFKDPSWPRNSNVNTGPNNGGELVFFANGTHNSAYFEPEGKFNASVTLVPGAEYTLTAGRYADNEQTRQLSVYAGYKKSDGSDGWAWLGLLTTPGLGAYTTTMRFKAPADMDGGLCTIGFALEPDQTAGIASIWNVNLVRAADASLIVDGAIKAEHLEAGSITASKVNADEIFLKADGDISLQQQWDDFGVQLDSMQSSIGFISRLATRADSTRRGIGLATYDVSGGSYVSGSAETKSLFTVSGTTVSATGAWKGRFILIDSYVPASNYSDNLNLKYVELSGSDNRSTTFQGNNAVFIWERDPVIESTTTIKPTATWDAPQNAWTTIPGMSTTLAAGATSMSINGNVYFTNVNRGSTYGVRVLVGGKVVWSWQSTTFGPLTILGNPTWNAPVRFECDVSGGKILLVQVLCGDANGYKRRVTTDTQVDVTSYIQT